MTFLDLFLNRLRPHLARWAAEQECKWNRQAKLNAYRLRHRWRKADVGKLLKIGVSSAAQKRLVRLLHVKNSGRGVIVPPKQLHEVILNDVFTLKTLADPNTPSAMRRTLYRRTRWFPYLIEAAYRGELQHMRAVKADYAFPHLKPSELAECAVADAAAISAALVRQFCDKVRKERGVEQPDIPATSAAALERHLLKGELPAPTAALVAHQTPVEGRVISLPD